MDIALTLPANVLHPDLVVLPYPGDRQCESSRAIGALPRPTLPRERVPRCSWWEGALHRCHEWSSRHMAFRQDAWQQLVLGRFARNARQGSTFAPQFVTGRFLRGRLSGRVPEQHVRVSVPASRVAFLHRTDKQDSLNPVCLLKRVVQRYEKRVPKTERIGLQRERRLGHEEFVRDRIHVMPHSVQRREDGKWHRDDVRARVASFS